MGYCICKILRIQRGYYICKKCGQKYRVVLYGNPPTKKQRRKRK